jgi:hypothetical protein
MLDFVCSIVRYGFSTATQQPSYTEKLDDNQEKEITRKAELEGKSEVAAAVNTSTRGKNTRSSRD